MLLNKIHLDNFIYVSYITYNETGNIILISLIKKDNIFLDQWTVTIYEVELFKLIDFPTISSNFAVITS